ncbi:hypothetical protein [Streptomyces sp. NPDC001492]
MTVLWATEELPGINWDPEPPDDEDDGPWCRYPDLNGQRASLIALHTMTTIEPAGGFL